MSMQRKTISITDQMDSWVKIQVDSGRYSDDSEYFQDLVRRDQELKSAESQLRVMLDDAESSGVSEKNLQTIWDIAENQSSSRNG